MTKDSELALSFDEDDLNEKETNELIETIKITKKGYYHIEDKKVNFPFIALLVIILLKNLAVKSFLVSVSLPT